MIAPGKIYCGDCAEKMKEMEDGVVKLTVTSPPYDKLRKYDGISFDFNLISEQLLRVTMDGGVLIWVCGDQLIDGSESGNSFRQALRFMDLGFKLHDTMIYCKQNPIPRKQKRYTQQFEYMFVFVKGELVTFNPKMEKCRYAGVKSTGKYFETPETEVPVRQSAEKGKQKKIAETKVKGNVWTYWVGRDTSEEKNTKTKKVYFPAKMHLQLAKDHVETWTNPGDLVFDPMCGSGTTLVAAKELGRAFLGIDISKKYVGMAKERVNTACQP